jgi:hypothetical protein
MNNKTTHTLPTRRPPLLLLAPVLSDASSDIWYVGWNSWKMAHLDDTLDRIGQLESRVLELVHVSTNFD